jgi:hypothetical protein
LDALKSFVAGLKACLWCEITQCHDFLTNFFNYDIINHQIIIDGNEIWKCALQVWKDLESCPIAKWISPCTTLDLEEGSRAQEWYQQCSAN